MDRDAGHSVVADYSWQAFPKGAAVSAICTTPWGDLWTGNARGSIRWGSAPYARRTCSGLEAGAEESQGCARLARVFQPFRAPRRRYAGSRVSSSVPLRVGMIL